MQQKNVSKVLLLCRVTHIPDVFFFSGVTHKEKLCFDRGRIQSDFDFSPLKLFKGQRRDQRVIRDLVAAQRRKKISTETSSRVF